MTPPRKYEPMSEIHVRLPLQVAHILRNIAEWNGVSPSELISAIALEHAYSLARREQNNPASRIYPILDFFLRSAHQAHINKYGRTFTGY